MAMNQFADISKDLTMQIKVVENLAKDGQFKEAGRLLTSAEKACGNLESLAQEDNKVQTHIVHNRRQEIGWLQDTIQNGLVKKPATRLKKRASK
jgi:hypothetical protein